MYCSYTNAKQGFSLTRLEQNALVSTSLSDNIPEKMIGEFLFYDRFQVLWQEYPTEQSRFPRLESGGGIFGMRSLRGVISGRDGVANFVLAAGQNELKTLEETAFGILSDPTGFASELFACLKVGGSCGYQADCDALHRLFEAVRGKADMGKAHPVSQFVSPAPGSGRIYTPREMLRFAVFIASWETDSAAFRPRLLWLPCPKQAISETQFLSLYTSNTF